MQIIETLFGSVTDVTWQMVVMWAIGGVLIFCAIKFDMEPTLLLPMGFGAILVNLPLHAVVEMICPNCEAVFVGETCSACHVAAEPYGPIATLLRAGIDNELFPLLLFIGIGAMIDFGPLLRNPKLMLFGAAAQFGIFFTLCSTRTCAQWS